jgi:hypothetical protein
MFHDFYGLMNERIIQCISTHNGLHISYIRVAVSLNISRSN